MKITVLLLIAGLATVGCNFEGAASRVIPGEAVGGAAACADSSASGKTLILGGERVRTGNVTTLNISSANIIASIFDYKTIAEKLGAPSVDALKPQFDILISEHVTTTFDRLFDSNDIVSNGANVTSFWFNKLLKAGGQLIYLSSSNLMYEQGRGLLELPGDGRQIPDVLGLLENNLIHFDNENLSLTPYAETGVVSVSAAQALELFKQSVFYSMAYKLWLSGFRDIYLTREIGISDFERERPLRAAISKLGFDVSKVHDLLHGGLIILARKPCGQ